MIKALIFDVDDTLIRTSETKYEALKITARTYYNLELSSDTIQTHWGKPFHQFMADLFGPVDSVEKIVKNYSFIRKDFPSPAYAKAVEVLLELANEYPLGITTASPKEMAASDLIQAGFNISLFHYIQTSDQTTVHKPNPKVFVPILSFFKTKHINAAEIVYIGDSLSDYAAASGAGLQFIGLRDRTTTQAQFGNHIQTIKHFSELRAAVESLSS